MESVYTIAIPMRCNRVFSATLIGVGKMVSEIRATLFLLVLFLAVLLEFLINRGSLIIS